MADEVVSGSASPSPTATARAPLGGVFPRRSRRPRELCVWVSACTAGAPRRTVPRFSAFHPTPTPFIKPAAQCGNMAGRDAGIGEFCHMAETCRWVPRLGTPVFAVVLMFSASPQKLSMWGGPLGLTQGLTPQVQKQPGCPWLFRVPQCLAPKLRNGSACGSANLCPVTSDVGQFSFQ